MNIINSVYNFSNSYEENEDTTPRLFATMNGVELTPTYTTNYARYTFTSTGKLFFTGILTDISVIIVGGGGGGGTMPYSQGAWYAGNGGGGGGGVGYGTLQIRSNNTLNISVGVGGTSLNNVSNVILASNTGGNTTIYGRNISENAYGGGAGQCGTQYASGLKHNENCGSGGGGSYTWQARIMVGGTASRGIGNTLTYFGNSGGTASIQQGGGGGGGGASAPGKNNNVGVDGVSVNGFGGNGGNGISIMVDNTNYGMYGSGGGGGNSSNGYGTKGGLPGSSSGGGIGGGNSKPIGIDASNNSGCGGGGASGAKFAPQDLGGKGGSGICIIFVPISAIPPSLPPV